MNNAINEIQKHIEGEKLLLEDREIYSAKEKELILNAIRFRVDRSPLFYYYYVSNYFTKLLNVCGKEMFNFENSLDLYIMTLIVNSTLPIDYHQKELDIDWSMYNANEVFGCPNGELYTDMIKKHIIPIEEIRKFYSFNFPVYSKCVDLDFIITNCFLLNVYPEFYNENSIAKVEELVETEISDYYIVSRKYYPVLNNAKKSLARALKKYKKNNESLDKKSKTKNIFQKR